MTIPIKQSEIQDLYKVLHQNDISIVFLTHYMRSERNRDVSNKLTPMVCEFRELLEACDESEIDLMVSDLHFYLKSLVERSRGEKYDLEMVALVLIMNKLQEIEFPFKSVVDYEYGESEVLKIYPELSKKIDKYGLFILDDDLTLHDGGIEYKDHILYYNQFLRKGYINSFNKDFINLFLRYYYKSRGKNKFGIAIDHSRILKKENYENILERDAWFGPEFKKEDLDNPLILGLTVKKRNEFYPYDFYNTLDRTEFLWSYKDDIKSLQIEEVSNIDTKYGDYNLNKYVHAERDTVKQTLRHFDGAVKVYHSHQYRKRFDRNLSHEAKGDKKIKLFRIDGDIDIDIWIDLIAYFFRGNEMIIEYFDPEKYEVQFGEVIERWKQHKLGINS